MVIDFDPQVGDQVRVFNFNGEFVIRERRIGPDGLYRFRLAPLSAGPELEEITYGKLDYSDEEKVRKVLPQILAASHPWPEDFQRSENAQGLSYDLRSDEMHDGTPTVVVGFHLKPGVIPSAEKARNWIEFYARLRGQFQFVNIDSWLQFTAKERQSASRAAS
jgi:hypothetical protein